MLHPHCTDLAISTLESLAAVDQAVRGDLAAAYYSRAQRDDRALDLLYALRWAMEADERRVETHFNRALVQQALGLTNEAVASWDEVLKRDTSDWADEARLHREALLAKTHSDPAAQWARIRERLAEALKRRDRAAVARLIVPFPSMALRYLEEEAAETRLLAEELSRNGDRYPLELVQFATPEQLAKLRGARRAYLARDWDAAANAYDETARTATGALRLAAQLGALTSRYQLGPVDPEPFDPLIREAAERNYLTLEWRLRMMRALATTFASRYVEALAEYDAALDVANRLRDRVSIARTHAHRSGVLRIFGNEEGAFRDSLAAVRLMPDVADPQNQHVILGELAAAVRLAGNPLVALAYQNSGVREVRRALKQTLDAGGILRLQYNLAVALRERAAISLELEHFNDATRDLGEARRLTGKTANTRVLRSRIEEVTGQSLLRNYPAQAAVKFTAALASAQAGEFGTTRVRLYAQRADALRRAGRPAEARADLERALAELAKEEAQLLASRKPGEAESLWSPYFERFQEMYQLLIRQLIEEGRTVEAFNYAERARAFEPLNLVLRTENVSPEFRAATGAGEPVPLVRIRPLLPAGTYLVHYLVHPGGTYAWIVGRDHFELLTLRARRADVERWTAAVQEAVRQRNASALNDALEPPYDGLAAEVLQRIGKKAKRLVIVPDGAMHGLPFAALRNPRTERYLIQESPALEFAASATLYLHSLDRDRKLSALPRSVLLVGNPAFDTALTLTRGMQPLPHAEKEVRRIGGIYGPSAEMLTGLDATVPEFLELARDTSVVHFAGHVIVNPRQPSQSLLLFAKSLRHPGVLNAEELLTGLKLDRTRLVVLSACSSAGGLPVGPEGVAPLVRPLIAAGVPAVIGSLWDVGDATAEELLVSFHRRYEQEGDAAEALRSAQLEMLGSGNPGLQPVLAWAPFQVIGHTSPDANTHQ